jgi:benzoate-CoA ligase
MQGTYNAAEDLLSRNLTAGRGEKTAFIDAAGDHTYQSLADRANQFANLLVELGVQAEQRIVLALLDGIDFPICFLGAIKAGVVPVPINTRLTARDYAYILADSRAVGLVISTPLLGEVLADGNRGAGLKHVLVSGADTGGHDSLTERMADQSTDFTAAATGPDDMCFWLYTSGTSGMPKGAVHLHSHLMQTAELYAQPVLGIREDDLVYSAAKLFFAYGLGNGLTFPMSVGATAILLPGPPDPVSVNALLTDQRPSIFFGVPTLFAMLLASDALPQAGGHAMRICVSAGEALPGDLMRRWKDHTGADILDGLGSTEMLHIFLSNSPDEITPGASGRPVPGYDLRIIGDDGEVAPVGELGMLEVSGPTGAVMYWNQREKSRETFRGPWTRTGDKYIVDANGIYTYCGRNDDMLKVGGIYVSPFEVEGALQKHDAVLEAAVVGKADADGLIKPKAFVVPTDGTQADDALATALTNFVKQDLANYKYPRWIEFVDALPKTATGKIQRFKLRDPA